LFRTGCCLIAAPLLFARRSIVVAVHLHAWAVFQEVHGLVARCHLVAPGSAIASELLWNCGLIHRPRYVAELIGLGKRGGSINIPADGAHDQHSKSHSKKSTVWRGSFHDTRNAAGSRSQDADRALSSIPIGLDIEGNELTDMRAHAIAWKRGDMREYFGTGAGGRNEAEAAIVIPLRQRTVSAHNAAMIDPS